MSPLSLDQILGNTSQPASAKGSTQPYSPPSAPQAEDTPPPPAYGALGTDVHGLPYYGDGFKGWVRKAWSDLTDPTKYMQDKDRIDPKQFEKIQSSYQSDVNRIASKIEEKTNWSDWGEKFFGLSAKELAASPAGHNAEQDIAGEIYKETGSALDSKAATSVGRAVRLGVDTTQNVIWGGLAILGIDDTVMRKIHATSLGIDSIADKYNADKVDNWFERINVSHPINVGKDLLTIAGAVASGKTTWAETWETTGKYRAGSAMVYSMIFDEMTQAEFNKGIAEGKDPGLLAQDLGHGGTELFGSIAGSPSTYLGFALKVPVLGKVEKLSDLLHIPWRTVFRIPNGGELLYEFTGGKVAIGATNAIRKTTELYFNNFIPELEDVLKSANSVNGNIEAEKVIAKASQMVVDKVNDMHKAPGFGVFALDSSGKSSVLSNQGALFINSVVMRYGPDVALRHLSDMVELRKGGIGSVQAAARLMGSDYNKLFFSTNGMMTGEILSRMSDSKIASLVEKHAGDPKNLAMAVSKALEDVTSQMIPSVDEMYAAKKLVDAGGEVSDQMKDLAKKYTEVPWVVRKVNEATKIPKAVSTATNRTMAFVYMDLAPRYFVRNIYGQSLMTAVHVGFGTALRTAIQAFKPLVPFVGKTLSESHINQAEEVLFKRLGMYSSRAVAGIGKVTQLEGKGMLAAAGRAEQITGSEIIKKASTDFLMDAMPKVVDFPEWKALTAKLPKEQQSLLYKALVKNYGNFDEAVKTLGKWTDGGEIAAWKLIDPPQALTKELDRMNLLDKFQELQDVSPTSDDFVKVVDEFIKKYDEDVTREAAKMPWVSDGQDTKELAELAQDLIRESGRRENEVITGLIQAHDNTYRALDYASKSTVEAARKILEEEFRLTGNRKKLDQLVEIEHEISANFDQKRVAKETMNYIRSEVADIKNELTKSTSLSPAKRKDALIDLWNRDIKYKGKSVFKLSEFYPDVDIDKISDPNEFRKLMWPAFFEKEYSDIYGATNANIYEQGMQKLNDIAELAGSKIDDLAGSVKSGDNPFLILAKYKKEAKNIDELFSYMRFNRQLMAYPDDAMLSQVIGKMDFKGWEGNKKHIVNAINEEVFGARGSVGAIERAGLKTEEKTLAKLINDPNISPEELAKAQKRMQEIGSKINPVAYEDITLKQAHRAISMRTARPVVPPDAGALPSAERAAWEGKDAFIAEVKAWSDKVVGEWGVKVPTVPADIRQELKAVKNVYDPRMAQIKTKAMIIGEATRDFVLHDYNKTYADHALTYLLGNSFHYWTTRTYKKSLSTLVDHPGYAVAYLAYKERMEKEHADMPEFYRRNISLGNLPGIDGNNEYFVNLESAINPIYGITGVDYNDPRKRVDTVSRMVDDLNKAGPSFSPLVQWAVALHMYNKGESEAAQRWLGRAIPQTSVIKSAASAADNIMAKFGIQADTKPLELDPFVHFLDGGVEPLERNRVAAAMGIMVQNGIINPATGQPVTQEQMIEASRLAIEQPKAPNLLWDAAVEYSADKRFLSDSASFFLGSAIRPRSQDDVKIERFWGEYSVLISSRNLMNADEYRQAWDGMREKYNFMDALLISRKTGVEQLTALSYNVLSRVQPGDSSKISEMVNIEPYMLDAFYEAKGDFNRMNLNEQDKARLKSGVIDLSVMLAMPDKATRQEWSLAKSEYSKMNTAMEKEFGVDIQRKISDFYETEGSQQQDYLELHPDVKQALDFRNAYIVGTPILTAYYGGLDVVGRFYTNQVYTTLDKEFGDMREKLQEYENLKITDSRAASKYKKQYLEDYYKRQDELYAEADKNIIATAPNIPDVMPYKIRPEFEAQSGLQEQALNFTQPQGRTWQDWQEVLSPPLQDAIMESISSGEDLKYSAQGQLKKAAAEMGISEYDALREIQILLQEPASPQADTDPRLLEIMGIYK